MRRGLLLDRDGVVNIDRGYVGARDRFEFMPGLFAFLRAAEDHGYRLAILTNQSGIARGLYTMDDFNALTAWMLGELRREGVCIDLVLGCAEHPDAALPAYARESFWRKPNPGMVLETLQRLRLDPARSAFLGDQPRDLEAAAAGGIGLCMLLNKPAMAPGMTSVKNFHEALRVLKALA